MNGNVSADDSSMIEIYSTQELDILPLAGRYLYVCGKTYFSYVSSNNYVSQLSETLNTY